MIPANGELVSEPGESNRGFRAGPGPTENPFVADHLPNRLTAGKWNERSPGANESTDV
jgi:hypothetical protein